MSKYLIFICSFFILFPAWSQDPLIKNNNNVQRARSLSEQFLAKGDISTAKVFLINAFNQDPTNFESLVALNAFHNKYEQNDQRAKSELIKLIENALYILKPDDVLTAMELLTTLNGQRAVEDLSTVIESDTDKITKEAESLLEFQLVAGDHIEQKLSDHLETLNLFLELNGNEAIDESLQQKLISHQSLIQRQFRLLSLANEVEKYTQLLKSTELDDAHKEQARAIMLSNAMNMIYSENLSVLPLAIKSRIDAVLTQAKMVKSSRSEAKSKQAYEEAKTIFEAYSKKVEEAKEDSKKLWEDTAQYFGDDLYSWHVNKSIEFANISNVYSYRNIRVNKNETMAYWTSEAILNHKKKGTLEDLVYEGSEVIDQMQSKSLLITESESVKAAKLLLKTTRKLIQGILKLQQKEYNFWASYICLFALQYHEKEAFHDNDAKSLFYQSGIKFVDVSLLTPEVNRVYHWIIEIIMDEERGQAVQFQKELMQSKKVNLRSF